MWIDNATLAHLRDVAEWPDLGERYDVRGRLGRGGMGVVYAAYDRMLDRDVAVKVLDGLHPEAGTMRMPVEARILGRLEHPGIVPVHDAGTLPDGRVFYVMKLMRGERLDVAVRSRSLNERLELFLRICDAVAFAHAHGVVHRDLKPDNIMLGAFGEVLVLDWGVAKVSDAREHDAVIGTPGYMAPEQQRGGTAVDHRVDVYALGIILRALAIEPAPRALAAIASRAAAPEADERYESVSELARDVSRFRDGDPVSAYQEPMAERVARIYRRYQLPIVLVLAYVIMRLVLLLWRGV
jgi:serine/threonine protein kinase